jgi:lysophospholipase L1-like esterase
MFGPQKAILNHANIPFPLYYNFTEFNLPNLASLLSSGGKILCAGDSTTAGYNNTNLSSSYPFLLPGDVGGNLVYDMCCGQIGADSRVAGGSTGGQPGIAPGYQQTGADTLAFTPTDSWDTADIYFAKGGVSGVSNVNINGGSTLGSLSTSGATSVGKLTVTGTAGVNTLNIVWVSGSVWPLVIDCYLSTAHKARVLGCGNSGATSTSYCNQSQGFAAPQMMTALNPKLTILNIGINDWETGVALSTYSANMQSMITKILAQGDCILMGPNSTGNVASEATQLTYIQAIRQLAFNNNIPMINIRSVLGAYATANSAGYMYNNLHPSTTGYAIIASAIAAKL